MLPREVRGRFSQELEVLVLLVDLFSQSQQLGTFRSAERLGIGPLRGLDPTTFVSDPALEGGLVDAQLTSHLGDAPIRVDDSMRRFDLVLGRESPPGW